MVLENSIAETPTPELHATPEDIGDVKYTTDHHSKNKLLRILQCLALCMTSAKACLDVFPGIWYLTYAALLGLSE